MKAGEESQTAVLVCQGRAVAHARKLVPSFSDPTALALLPDDARGHVARFLAGDRARGVRAAMAHAYLRTQATIMAVRTVAIDDAIRAAAAPQLVILGAGLDGRAWRMTELERTVTFEVDHPDSQRKKRARAAALTPTAAGIRFVPVDFGRDSLDAALAAAGHDPALPTTWIWEGVVMYLSPPDIERTLATVARRSAPTSGLALLYHAPSWLLHLVGPFVRRLGEPLRSVFRPAELAALLGRHGFTVTRDDDLATLGARETPEVARGTRVIRHLRIAVARRS